MHSGLYLLAFVAGAALVVQIGMNAVIGRAFGGNAVGAVFVNFTVGAVGLFLFLVATRAALPQREQVVAIPTWAWFGGLIGAFYVATVTIAGPRVGALAVLALTVAGQMAASLLVDHFGLLGFPREPVSLLKLFGAGLLFAGVVIVAR
jgi:bacterial/archaeal transporter family-2 protein